VEDVALCRHELEGEQVVCGEPVLGHEPAEAASERVSRDARRRDGATGHCKPVRRCGVVQLRPDDAAPDRGRFRGGIDSDALHQSEIDHHATVCHGSAGDVVATAANRDLELGTTSERQSGDDVVRGPAAHDQRRLAVDQAVVNRARLVVVGIVRVQNSSGDGFREIAKLRGVECCGHFVLLLGRYDQDRTKGDAPHRGRPVS
jgi:hypothetical protein